MNGETWSSEAISCFKSKVQNKTLYARLYPEEEDVQLFDDNSSWKRERLVL